MTENDVGDLNWIRDGVRRDGVRIWALAVVIAAVGGYSAWREPQATSTAQLVLTTIPVYAENQNEIEDIPTKLLAVPLDVKSASLLCKSDETLRRTLEALGGADAAISLPGLRDSLRCEFSIAEESPMEIVFSPILKLTARAKNPAEAKRRADTWAKVCVEMAREYKAKRQGAIKLAYENALENFRERIGQPISGVNTATYEQLVFRAEFARIGADGNPPELQVLSPGAVWPVNPLRHALEAAVAGFFGGLFAGMILSVCLRFALQSGPAKP